MLAKHILSTLAYYDVFGYPLTVFETWRNLIVLPDERVSEKFNPCSLGRVMTELETLKTAGTLASSQGFYTLSGREHLVGKRLERMHSTLPQLKRVRRLAGWLRFVPFMRMVGVTGSLAMKNSGAGSDWDLLISVRPGHIWTGRSFVTLLVHILGKRRHGTHVRKRACLNYWITSDSLEVNPKDLFAAHEYSYLIPMFGGDEYRRFQAANGWITTMRPHFSPVSPGNPDSLLSAWCLPDTRLARFARQAGEALSSSTWLERRLGAWQRRKIMKNPKTHLPGSLIAADDRALIFLPKPHGPKVFARFQKRLDTLALSASEVS